MVQHYDGDQTEVVIGYGPYSSTGGFVNMLVRYDTFLVAMQYLSLAIFSPGLMHIEKTMKSVGEFVHCWLEN